MWQEFVPQIERKIGMGATQAGDEMILEGLDGSFGPVSTMESSGGELAVNVFSSHEVGQEFGCFVVQAMKLGTEAAELQEAKDFGIGGLDGLG